MVGTEAAAWAALGKMLVQQRVQLDPRYMNRSLFAAERHINGRLAADIEKGRRQNYDAATVAAVEVAYGLPSGAIARAIARALSGDDPGPVPPAAHRPPPGPAGDGYLPTWDGPADLLARCELEVAEEVLAATEVHGPNPPAAVIFPGDSPIAVWERNVWSDEGLSRKVRQRMVAIGRAERARGAGEGRRGRTGLCPDCLSRSQFALIATL